MVITTIHKKRIAIFAIIGGLLCLGGIVPLRQNINGACRLEPAAVWQVTRDGAGQIAAEWCSNHLNLSAGNTLFHFQRPDLVEVMLAPGLKDGTLVEKGDTVAVIISREGEGRLQVIEAALQQARANLAALQSGAKFEELEVARRRIERYSAELAAMASEYQRKTALYDSGHISISELELAKGQLEALKARVEQERAEYNALRTGARPQDLEVAKAEIHRLEQERFAALATLGINKPLVAPLRGVVNFGPTPGLVLSVQAVDTLLLTMFVPETAATSLKSGIDIEARLYGDPNRIRHGSLLKVGFFADTIPGAYAQALIPNPDGSLSSGMNGRATIPLGEITLLQGFKIKLSPLAFRF